MSGPATPLLTPPIYTSSTSLTPSPGKRPPLQLTTEPRCLRFSETDPEGKSTRELKILNVGGHRMAWRVMSNAPRLYLVNPSKGFVAPKESSRSEVTLIDTAKRSPKHQFVIQMKKAGDEEIDREEIWERKDECIVQNLRLVTGIEQDATKSRTSSTSSPRGLNHSPATSSSANSGTSTPKNENSEHTPVTAISPGDPLAHGEFVEDIKKLGLEVQKALDEKAERTMLLTKAVNDVKLLEQELDRETNRLYESSRRHEVTAAEVMDLKKRKEESAKEAFKQRHE